MSDELTPISAEPAAIRPARSRPGLGTVILVILLTTAALLGLLYLGAQLLNLPFTPFDLYDWPIRAGFAPWISLIDALNGAQTAEGGNIAQSAPLVRWLLSLVLFLALALAVGLAFYAFILRRGRIPDLIDGLTIGALFAAPMILVSLTTSPSTLPAALIGVWLAALCLVWGVVLSYAFGRLMEGATVTANGETTSTGIGRRQFLVQFGAGAAAITAVSAAAGAALAPGRETAQLQRTLPMISPEFLAAQQELFGNFRRFVIVRGGAGSAADSNVLALGAEYPDRNYVSIWLGGRSPIVIYENLATALAAYSTAEAEAGIYWLDN
jgi:hypothetical protein